jgi:hypothetical protein
MVVGLCGAERFFVVSDCLLRFQKSKYRLKSNIQLQF